MVENATNSVKKPRVEISNTASENRKLRNRLSQKAFRARQSLYIKDLEKRLEWASKPESDQNAKLEETNRTLRDQLLDCHKKLESFQVTLKALADSVACAIGLEQKHSSPSENHPSPSPDESDDGDVTPTTHINIQSEWNHGNNSAVGSTYFDFPEIPMSTEPLAEQSMILSPKQSPEVNSNINTNRYMENSLDVITRGHFGPTSSTIATSFEQMMGPLQYSSFVGDAILSPQGQVISLQRTNSNLSDHITICESYIRDGMTKSGGQMMTGDHTKQVFPTFDDQDSRIMARTNSFFSLLNTAFLMLSTFIYISWPRTKAWHKWTKAHIPVIKLIAWHVNPTNAAYADLSHATTAYWLPTKIQMSIPHPSIIDWVPYPTLRDRLILCHSANPCIDEIICDIGHSYVVETHSSKLVVGLNAARCYVSVWEVVRAMTLPETQPDHVSPDEVSWNDICRASAEINTNVREEPQLENTRQSPASSLPAPSVNAIFESSHLALSVFNALNMGGGIHYYKIDPTFFERHPELYDGNASLVANGVALRPKENDGPPPAFLLSESVLKKYRDLVSWSTDIHP